MRLLPSAMCCNRLCNTTHPPQRMQNDGEMHATPAFGSWSLFNSPPARLSASQALMELQEAGRGEPRERRRQSLLELAVLAEERGDSSFDSSSDALIREVRERCGSFQQALLEAELVLAPDEARQVFHAYLAGPCPRMLFFSVEGLGALAPCWPSARFMRCVCCETHHFLRGVSSIARKLPFGADPHRTRSFAAVLP